MHFQKLTSFKLVQSLVVAALVLTALLVYTASGEGRVTAFGGAFIVDDFARLMKVLALLGAAVTVLMSGKFLARIEMAKFEYPILVMLASVGMMMMISANDLISLYMGLELQSLSLYVIAAFNRDSAKSSEAGLKYFVLGALSSGMLLYGASLVYGFTGTTTFAGIAEALTANGSSLGIIFGLVFVLAGLAFKISAVPFHMWTPDVYEGAPTPVTAFFASAPKVAAMALSGAHHGRPLQPAGSGLAANPCCGFDFVDGFGCLCCHRPVQHQAPFGLFLYRTHGFCARRLSCWDTGRRFWRCHLYADLRAHHIGCLRLCVGHAPPRHCRLKISLISQALDVPIKAWLLSSPC